MSLLIATPTLPAASVQLTQPLIASIPAPTYDDGSNIAPADLEAVGVFVFRGPPGSGDIWDQDAKTWRSLPADPAILALKPIGAAPPKGGGPWSATLVAVGQKDGAGQPVYAAAAGGVPTYYMRGYARARRAGADQAGLSAASAAFTFTDPTANARFGVLFDTPATPPDSAHRARLQLKGDALQPAGYLEIRSQPSFEVEVTNCDATGNPLARVLLRANGEIQLTPAPGMQVVIDGDLEVGRVLYEPYGGGPKTWLL